MIYLTGDTHGDTHRFTHIKYSKDDYIIILGDFGMIWGSNESELNCLAKKNGNFLFIDGNHENFNRIEKLPTKEMFGADVGYVRDNVFHLRRGRVYDIEGKSFLAFGGARSIDKDMRTENVDWWPQELPTREDFNTAINNLARRDFAVDYILSHTLPEEQANTHLALQGETKRRFLDTTEKMLSKIVAKTNFTKLYCGHWHVNKTIDKKFSILYRDIVKLGE